MSKKSIYLDSFDHDTDEPSGLRGAALDKHVLSNSKRVSIFWITETQARAKRITNWEKEGSLVLDNTTGYPWLNVDKFELPVAQ